MFSKLGYKESDLVFVTAASGVGLSTVVYLLCVGLKLNFYLL